MNRIYTRFRALLPIMLAIVVAGSSCNKDVADAVPIAFPQQPGSTIGQVLASNANLTVLRAAVTKAGLLDAVSNPSNVFTVFAPSDAAFAAAGINAAVINALPAASVAQIVSYHVIPGQKITSAGIPTQFPNVQMPTSLIFPSPNTNPLVRFSSFPSKRGSSVWVNNIPVVTPDVGVSNGVVHVTAFPVMPPSRVLLDTISRDADMQYLVAAVLRADLALPAGSKFQQVLANPLANFTVFAPTNEAFIDLFVALGLPRANVTPASFNLLNSNTVAAILAYHVFRDQIRAFGANLPTTPTSYLTFYTNLSASAPSITIDATQGVKGLTNPVYSKITAADRHAINGVYHKIDRVLRFF